MNAKLTLTVEQSVIEKAKKYAKKKGRSLSGLIENYLKSLAEENPKNDFEFTPTVKSLKGSFQIAEDVDYKEELSKALTKKYL